MDVDDQKWDFVRYRKQKKNPSMYWQLLSLYKRGFIPFLHQRHRVQFYVPFLCLL